jgi:hypothetical protein
MRVEELFGVNAGKIWRALKERGEKSVMELMVLTKLTRDEVWGALGWLAREGKIRMEKFKKGFRFKLTE